METHAQKNPNPQSMRVLLRPTPQIPPPPPPPPDPSPPPPSPSPSSSSPNGIVVVGFIGRRHDDVTQLINRVVDDNVFGSGHWDTPFRFEKQELVSEEVRQWFESRSISFYLDQEKGILYLQFSSTICPVEKDYNFEECEFRDLQGWLFMFSVCHVVVLLQEGSQFDTQLLKKFRVLQASKNALSPYLKSHIVQPSNIHASSSIMMSNSVAPPNNPSAGRSRGILNRFSGSMTLMSGLGSYPSLLPGQCNPVILFVFLDDFMDANSNSGMGEQAEASTLSQSSSNSMARTNLQAKGSGSVVVLARPAHKSDGGFRKKLQSSLEAQIRFSIKKCRILSSSESGHVGSRSGGLSSSSPLFLLDASKAVTLIDLFSNSRGASLEFATNLVEDVLDGKATSDSLLLESNGQNTHKEDILSVKEFILRQCDILRGRGGVLSSSGPATGVGMVAVAAAAAAASAASGKTFTTPDLPSLDSWLSTSLPILQGILSVKTGNSGDDEFRNGKHRQQDAVLLSDEESFSKVAESVKYSASILESGRDLSSKFSTLWCEKILPVAKELYLKELPPCYPSLQHAAHLERAMAALRSMVKGPAVPLYTRKLEEECTSIWISGRQLCDAVSLTGKPCMHERHACKSDGLHSRDEIKQHASGYLFLHACACGRSRQLRSDPFDFEAANITFNIFSECDKLLPAFEIPQTLVKGPIQPSCWSLIRIGGAKYYNPAKGLLQSGFAATQKFLLKSTLYLGKQNMSAGSSMTDLTQAVPAKLSGSSKDEFHTEKGTKILVDTRLQLQVPSGVGIEKRKTLVTIKTDDTAVNPGRITSSSNMKKPFSEVVAGSAGANSAFPPLQPRRQPALGAEKGNKLQDVKENTSQVTMEIANSQGSQKVRLDDDGVQGLRAANGVPISVNGITNGDPDLKIGVLPINLSSGGIAKEITSLEHVVCLIGFEHECPRGHRFILNPDHLKDLGSYYAVPKESTAPLSIEDSDNKVGDSAKFVKNGSFKTRRQSNGIHNSAVRANRNLEDSKMRVANKNVSGNGQMKVSALPRDKAPSSLMDTGASLESIPPEEDGAMSLLNRNLPLYMNCPHCRGEKKIKDPANVRFASSISQLQRIFLVTPAFPVILSACPVIQFEESCLPSTVPNREQKLQFGLGCPVILPPESFLSMRLPFVYGIELEDGTLQPLTPLEDQPHLTAWIKKGTTLQILSDGSNSKPGFVAK